MHPTLRFTAASTVVLAALLAPRPAVAQTCTSTITVRTVVDAAGTCPGASCSLRTAIAQANANPDCTRIAFDFTPAFGGYIALVSPLPTITSPVEIDGWSHPNSTRFPENGVGPSPVFRVGIRGDTNNIAGAGCGSSTPATGWCRASPCTASARVPPSKSRRRRTPTST